MVRTKIRNNDTYYKLYFHTSTLFVGCCLVLFPSFLGPPGLLAVSSSSLPVAALLCSRLHGLAELLGCLVGQWISVASRTMDDCTCGLQQLAACVHASRHSFKVFNTVAHTFLPLPSSSSFRPVACVWRRLARTTTARSNAMHNGAGVRAQAAPSVRPSN